MIKKYALLQKSINQRLEAFFKHKTNEATGISPFLGKLVKEKRNFVMAGGKRIRPVLFYIGYLMGDGKDKKAALDASICIELIHNYLLVHDDIIDQDTLRRGKPTLHITYKTLIKNLSSSPEHLGTSLAIVGGDILAMYGYEALSNATFPDNKKLQAIKVLNKILSDVTIGQDLDILYASKKKVTIQEILRVAEYKTAKYTIEGPLKLGATLAGANKGTLKVISDYALPLGIAFQIHDDILGMFGDKKRTGKSSDSDIKQHKQNLLLLYAKEHSRGDQKKTLRGAKLTTSGIERVKKIVKDTGSLDHAQALSRQLVEQSKGAIRKSSASKEVKEFLVELADYIIARKS